MLLLLGVVDGCVGRGVWGGWGGVCYQRCVVGDVWCSEESVVLVGGVGVCNPDAGRVFGIRDDVSYLFGGSGAASLVNLYWGVVL